MEHETIDVAPENEETKLVPITALLEMVASRLGVVVCGWAAAVLVQGGILFMLQTKDRVFVTVMFLLVCFRYWGNLCPPATDGSLTEASRSLSANNRQQLAVPIHFISRFFYWCKLVSAMTSVVLSIMRLASHDFGQTEVANMVDRDFALIVFYGLALAEALLLLFALTFVTIMAMQRTGIKALFKLAKPSEPAPAPLSQPPPAPEPMRMWIDALAPRPKPNAAPRPKTNAAPRPKTNDAPRPKPNAAPRPKPNAAPWPKTNDAPLSQPPPAPEPMRMWIDALAPRPKPNTAPRPKTNAAPRPKTNDAPRPKPNAAPRPKPNAAPWPKTNDAPLSQPPPAPEPMRMMHRRPSLTRHRQGGHPSEGGG